MIEKLKNILSVKPIFSVAGVFLLLLSIILGVYLVRQMTQLSSKAAAPPSATLSIVPSNRDAGLNQEISFDVIFDKGTNRSRAAKITGADLFISADSNIQINRFVPDAASKLNTEFQNQVVSGSLRYAAVNLRNDGSLPSDQIITLGKLFVQATGVGTLTVRFDDNNTHIVASGYKDEVPLSLRTTTVTVVGSTPPSPSPSSSPSAPPVSVIGDVDKNGCLNPANKGGTFVGDPVLIWQMIRREIGSDPSAILFVDSSNPTRSVVDMRDYTTWWNIYRVNTVNHCPR